MPELEVHAFVLSTEYKPTGWLQGGNFTLTLWLQAL
jgi:hypothetical protein